MAVPAGVDLAEAYIEPSYMDAVRKRRRRYQRDGVTGPADGRSAGRPVGRSAKQMPVFVLADREDAADVDVPAPLRPPRPPHEALPAAMRNRQKRAHHPLGRLITLPIQVRPVAGEGSTSVTERLAATRVPERVLWAKMIGLRSRRRRDLPSVACVQGHERFAVRASSGSPATPTR